MGDVYVARHSSVSGFEKHCVLKTAVMLTEVLLSQGLHVHAYGSRR